LNSLYGDKAYQSLPWAKSVSSLFDWFKNKIL